MKKLILNKKIISQLDASDMKFINGGNGKFTCIVSCKEGSRRTKQCCDDGISVTALLTRDDKDKENNLN